MTLPAIILSQGELQRFNEAIGKEWLVTNGIGGYASSTVLGLNTRKYHGLLVAALHPPADRTVCLSKLDEEIVTDGAVFPINSNEFPNSIFPKGYNFLKTFTLSPFPKYAYSTEAADVEKTIFMPQEKNEVIALYKVKTKNQKVRIRIYPLLNFRHFHSVTDIKKNQISLHQTSRKNGVRVMTSTPHATIALTATDGDFTDRPIWIERILYREEVAREESSHDDCYQPGFFEFKVPPNYTKDFAIIAAAHEDKTGALASPKEIGETAQAVNALCEKEVARHQQALSTFYSQHKRAQASDWLDWLLQAADTFVVKSTENARYVIAGYHWFESWGRDTFISLPGLTLVTGRFEDAKRILLSYKAHIRNGLVPNVLPDKSHEPSYNTVDSTLWCINALLQYLQYTSDFEFVHSHLWETLKTIIDRHREGTDYEIHIDNDCLLSHGPQLTWMDSQIDGKAVTRREGKAVEIQALWYNALKTMEMLAIKFEESHLADVLSSLAAKARESFNNKFWNPKRNCLYDSISSQGADASIRPNQVISASLSYSIIDEDKIEPLLDVVQRELVTPCGLRTLAKSEPGYVGSYSGDRRQRDQAYHNGTVWPWLLGPFVSGWLKAKSCDKVDRQTVFARFLQPLLSKQVYQAGLGTVSEIFDGDPPHAPRGCTSQAWSVAEPLRAYIEDILQIRPKYEKSATAS